MAVTATLTLDCGILAMKTLTGSDILRDVSMIVTIGTQLVLFVPVKFRMTGFAFSLELGMRLNHRPRHQEIVKNPGCAWRGQKERQEKERRSKLDVREHHN